MLFSRLINFFKIRQSSKLAKSRLSKFHLRILFSLFFLTLAIPAAILSYIAYEKLRWESFHQFQKTAQSLTLEINNSLSQAISKEESRSDSDYTFLVFAGDPSANFLQRSDLSRYPVESHFPGIIGYFQINADGQFSTPLLPSETAQSNLYGISTENQLLRKQLAYQIQNILSQNQLVSASNIAIKSEPSEKSGDSSYQIADLRENEYQPNKNDRQNDAELDGISLEEKMLEEKVLEKNAVAKRGLKTNESFVEQEKIQITGSRIKSAEEKPKRKPDSQAESKRSQAITQESVSSGFSALQSPVQQQKITQYLGKLEGFDSPDTPTESPAVELQSSISQAQKKRTVRKETNYIPQSIGSTKQQQSAFMDEQDNSIQHNQMLLGDIKLFESELEPFRFSLLKSRHFVAYRQVWREGNRLFQGAILSVDDFFMQAIQSPFKRSPLADFTQLRLAYGDKLLISSNTPKQSYRSQNVPVNGELLLSSSMAEPFSQLSLLFYTLDMPTGDSGGFFIMIAVLLMLALVLGTYALYRLTYRQSFLAQQQQDFISSVSHELKTPITSIKMYGEILKQGWADKNKQAEYFDFIVSEAERLSRLIANILQISKVSRNHLSLEIKKVSASEIASLIQSKIDSQIAQSGFKYQLDCDQGLDRLTIAIDLDAFAQIIINLVDNAIKYAARSDNKLINIRISRCENNQLKISVRDYGPGIAKDQRDKIFQLFYRIGNEMTRESKGTGIGLALVEELTVAMKGRIQVNNVSPGTEFSLFFETTNKSD